MRYCSGKMSKDPVHQKSLIDEGYTEEKVTEYDAIVLEDHACEATPEEKGRWHNKWCISLNKERKQSPVKQRPDFRDAKHTCRLLYKQQVESSGQGNQSIHPARQRKQNFSTTI